MPWIMVVSWIQSNWREVALGLGILSMFGWAVSCKRVIFLEGQLATSEVRRSELAVALSQTSTAKAESRVVIRYLPAPDGKPSPCPDVDLTAFAITGQSGSQNLSQTASTAGQNGPPAPQYGLWLGFGYLEAPYASLGASYGPWLVEGNLAPGPVYGGGLRYKALAW